MKWSVQKAHTQLAARQCVIHVQVDGSVHQKMAQQMPCVCLWVKSEKKKRKKKPVKMDEGLLEHMKEHVK